MPQGLPATPCFAVIPRGFLTKAFHFVPGFVASLGASLEVFAGDIRAILDAKLKNGH